MRLKLEAGVERRGDVVRGACCVGRGRSSSFARFNPAGAARAILKRAQAGFTLAEALVAITFMAIVIPVAVNGLHVASLAGEVGQRKAVAARIGNSVLNDMKVENKLQSSGQNGFVQYDGLTYHWTLKTELWTQDPTTPMLQATITVSFPAQGQTYDVRLSTLISQNTM
jgi:Tfp pilus assembly protein PilV